MSCKQIYEEASDIIYKYNTLIILAFGRGFARLATINRHLRDQFRHVLISPICLYPSTIELSDMNPILHIIFNWRNLQTVVLNMTCYEDRRYQSGDQGEEDT